MSQVSDMREQTDSAGEFKQLTGLVLKSTGSWYQVLTEDGVIQARIRGKFRLEEKNVTNPLAVGDRVDMRMENEGTGLIVSIHQRTSKLSRLAAGRGVREHVIAANVDMAWCVQAVKFPKYKPGFIDRFLVMAEVYGLSGGVIFNKADLLPVDIPDDLLERISMYREIGYPVFLVSSESGAGLEELKKAMKDQINVFAGPSGVGKSTLLNALEPQFTLRTGEVSRKTEKGRHTTTFAELFELSFGGFVVDTPGLREFGIWDLTPEELGGYFREMLPYVPECRYPSCTHDHEPDCAVKDAVDVGQIHLERYGSYLNILADLQSTV